MLYLVIKGLNWAFSTNNTLTKKLSPKLHSTKNIKLKLTKETHTCNCEMNKGKNNLSTYDDEERKKDKTLNVIDAATVNERGNCFSINGCGKKSANQRMNESAHHQILSGKYP